MAASNAAAEMKFLRSIKGCTILDKIRNEDICRELKIFCIKDKIQKYRQDWLDHVQRMPRRRLPRAALYTVREIQKRSWKFLGN